MKPGTEIGAYRIEAPLGEGGAVYRARDTKRDRPVAIRLLPANLGDANLHEAQRASSLNHPHILTVYDVGEFEGRPYIVTEFVDGETLKDWAREKRSWKQVLELLIGVADGIAAAHAAGIVHGNVRAANILVDKDGRAKLTDFGLAKLGEARDDIFSFGIVMDEVLTGGARLAERYPTMRDLVVDLRRSLRSSRSLAWGLATAVGLAALLAGYVAHAGLVSHTPKQEVRVLQLTDMVGLEESAALSPDGKTVAFVAAVGGRRQIWVRRLAGGTPLAITKDDADHDGPRWSPDSESLSYYTPGAIWEVPASGGPTRKIVSALGPGDFSHDGNSLAFFRFEDGAMELALATRDAATIRVIAKLRGGVHYSHPRWSPDDREIAFLREENVASSSTDLMVEDAGGGEPRSVGGEAAKLHGFSWSPDGTSLIVSSARDSIMSYPPTFNLWAIPHEGSKPLQLTFGESSYESPDVSPKGDLAASRVRSHADVWKFPITGDPAENARLGVRVTHQTGQVQSVSVSPDESEIAFLSDSGGHANVWLARTSDGEMRPLTHESDPRVMVGVPARSPRGDLIGFPLNHSLWVANPDGSGLRDLGVQGEGVCWSADGRWVYYGTAEKGDFQIDKVAVAGGQPSRVRDDNAAGCAAARDGSTLYYLKILTQADGTCDLEIRAAHPENGPSRVIGRVAGARIPAGVPSAQPVLSPDGKWLAIPLIDGATVNLWALPTGGGEWKKLTDFGTRNVTIVGRVAWSKDGKYIYAAVSDVDSDIVTLSGLNWR